jgi:hypothetical protein
MLTGVAVWLLASSISAVWKAGLTAHDRTTSLCRVAGEAVGSAFVSALTIYFVLWVYLYHGLGIGPDLFCGRE